MSKIQLPKLYDLPLTIKTVASLALVVLGLGYVIALYNLYLTYNLTDGQPGLTANDLKRAFYGNRDNTKLAAKIDGGGMAQFLTRRGDKEKILSWIQDGAEREGFDRTVRPILARNCIRCHNPTGLQRFAPLTSYQDVMVVTQVDRGEPAALWARVAHTHIQSIGLIFLVLGVVFAMTSLPERLKVTILILPYAALVLDFGTRALAKFYPDIVYLMMATGALMGLLFALMTIYPLYEMWFRPGAD